MRDTLGQRVQDMVKRLLLGTIGVLLTLAAMGILEESGLFPRMSQHMPFDWRYAAIGLPMLALGVWIGRKGLGPAIRFRFPRS